MSIYLSRGNPILHIKINRKHIRNQQNHASKFHYENYDISLVDFFMVPLILLSSTKFYLLDLIKCSDMLVAISNDPS